MATPPRSAPTRRLPRWLTAVVALECLFAAAVLRADDPGDRARSTASRSTTPPATDQVAPPATDQVAPSATDQVAPPATDQVAPSGGALGGSDERTRSDRVPPAGSSGGAVQRRPGPRGWQLSRANTGLAGVGLTCAALPVYSGPELPPAGTVISGVRIESSLVLSNGPVTIERSCIRPLRAADTAVTTVDNDACPDGDCPPRALSVIRDSDFDGTALGLEAGARMTAFKGLATLQRNYVHGFGSGLAILWTGTEFDALVEGNYVTGLRSFGDAATTGTHSDAFTLRGFDTSRNPRRQAIIRDNRFNCDGGNESGALFVQPAAGNIDNMTAEGNLLEGGGYQMVLTDWAHGTFRYGRNMRAVDNRFSGTGYGPATVSGPPGWAEWRDNFINDPSKPDHRGAAVADPGH